ncbi:MAG: hypothetical protein HQL54_03375 [Magnetococcales bacterium]|nr:hypothetical protein [Magnetococcales bacterium]
MRTVRETFRHLAFFALMIVTALTVDWGLHFTGHLDWGREAGYVGTGLLVVSFLYSARKRKWIQRGRPPLLLRLHETLSWIGAMLILVHGGIHFNALLPWVTMAAMMIAVASGLTGKYLFKKSRTIVSERRKTLREKGMDIETIDAHLYWDALLVGMMKKWRIVHIPITITFALLVLLHIVTVLIFWKW